MLRGVYNFNKATQNWKFMINYFSLLYKYKYIKLIINTKLKSTEFR